MLTRYRMILRAALLTCFCMVAAPAFACTVSTPANPTEFGTYSSSAVAASSIKTSASATGISCVNLLEVGSQNYLALRFIGSIPPLKSSSTSDTINLIISWNADGPALVAGTLYSDYTSTLLGLLNSTGGGVTLHYRTQPTLSVRAGVYESELDARWYYSVCTIGLLGVCVQNSSPGLTRSGCLLGVCTGPVTNEGTGSPVKIKLRMVVQRDCTISAPTVNFGTRPLPDTFDTISQTATVRCSVGDTYAVALDDGKNSSGGTRRMANGSSYLEYDIFKGTSGTDRWGSSLTERRSSDSADVAPNVHDGVATQSYHYRARIRPVQPTAPIAGAYKDTLRLSIIF